VSSSRSAASGSSTGSGCRPEDGLRPIPVSARHESAVCVSTMGDESLDSSPFPYERMLVRHPPHAMPFRRIPMGSPGPFLGIT
jgi:hypothetical protein